MFRGRVQPVARMNAQREIRGCLSPLAGERSLAVARRGRAGEGDLTFTSIGVTCNFTLYFSLCNRHFLDNCHWKGKEKKDRLDDCYVRQQRAR
jgi:hypothetical protein